MSKKTEVVISARCGAAARDGVNEDNCLVMESVGKHTSKINHFGDGEYISKVLPLERNGSLLVVADGMGGMNAGEVASAIAIETIANAFKSESIGKMELTDSSIKKFMVNAIRQADMAIKKEALADPEKEGMGTTIVMLWIFEQNAYYAWCGDSRLYHFHDGRLFQLSRDHSYVCEVLGLSETEAFDHPDNNIITRCLGNPTETVRPDVCGPLQYFQGDLFLLCSDGLCGVVRNAEIGAALQFAVENNDKLNLGNLNLWEVAESNQWHDNVTTLLCYVANGQQAEESAKKPTSEMIMSTSSFGKDSPIKSKKKGRVFILIVVILLLVSLFAFLWLREKNKTKEESPTQIVTEEVVTDDTSEEVDVEGDWLETDEGNVNESLKPGENKANLPAARAAKGGSAPEVNQDALYRKKNVQQPSVNATSKKDPAPTSNPSTGPTGTGTVGGTPSTTPNVTPTNTQSGTATGTQNGTTSGTKKTKAKSMIEDE